MHDWVAIIGEEGARGQVGDSAGRSDFGDRQVPSGRFPRARRSVADGRNFKGAMKGARDRA